MCPKERINALQNDVTPAKESELHHQQVQDTLRNFRVIFSSVRRHFHWIETQCGVSGAQLWAMGKLLETPGSKVSELARAMFVHQSTASNLLDKLESKGLIQKKRDTPDQRVVRLYLTEAGEEVVNRAPRPFEGILPNALQSLPSDALESLNASLIQLVEQMAVKDEKAGATPLSDIR